ncbi:MAG: hypothetical protein RIQ53_3062 [Pseudomonadota bacterium]|jgi:predicted lipoprotein
MTEQPTGWPLNTVPWIPGHRAIARAAGLACAGVLWTTAPVQAQNDWRRTPVPVYTPGQLVAGLQGDGLAAAGRFARDSQALAEALRQRCSAVQSASARPSAAPASALAAPRAAWLLATRSWERQSAVALGPLIEQQSLRQLDFQPTRPALIDKAVAARPRDGAALERIGTPAKGLPALEHLLWTRPVAAGTPECDYAVAIADELARAADGLRTAQATLAAPDVAARELDEAAQAQTLAAYAEWVNQWVGGLERLRWAQIGKPAASGRPTDFPRAASASTVASWAAHWATLRHMSVHDADGAPADGALVPFETQLRSKGLNPLADRLLQAVRAVDASLPAARPGATARSAAAVRALGTLKHLAENEVATALNVTIGFSDADGD